MKSRKVLDRFTFPPRLAADGSDDSKVSTNNGLDLDRSKAEGGALVLPADVGANLRSNSSPSLAAAFWTAKSGVWDRELTLRGWGEDELTDRPSLGALGACNVAELECSGELFILIMVFFLSKPVKLVCSSSADEAAMSLAEPL